MGGAVRTSSDGTSVLLQKTREIHHHRAVRASCRRRVCPYTRLQPQFAADKTAPDRTTLDRARRDRFSDRLTSFSTQSAKRILAVAHDMGNPLGMRALEPTDKSDCSNRSQQRYIIKKAKDVTDALCQIVFPVIDLDRPDDGTQYADTTSLDLQSYLGLTGTAANQGSRTLNEETTRDAGGPASDTHLQYIKE